jgi:hypothetical protein
MFTSALLTEPSRVHTAVKLSVGPTTQSRYGQ